VFFCGFRVCVFRKLHRLSALSRKNPPRMPPLHAGDFFFFVMKNRDEKIGIRKFGNRWVAKGEIHTVPAALPLLLLADNEAAFFIRINGQG
jgi:hypothetical protein